MKRIITIFPAVLLVLACGTITKTFAPRVIEPGQTTILTFTLENSTTNALTNAHFTDILPITAAGELEYVNGSEGGTCLAAPFNGVAAYSTTVVGDDTLEVTGMGFDDASGVNTICTVTVTVQTTATSAGIYNNVSSILSADQGDGPAPATAILQVGIIQPPTREETTDEEPAITIFDPGISKIGVLAPGELGILGEQIVWTIVVTNNGSAPGSNVVITDTLRDELRIDNVSTTSGTYTIVGQTVTVTIPVLNPGESVTILITTTVLESDITVDNMACLGADDFENGDLRCVIADVLQGGELTVTELPATGETPLWTQAMLVMLAIGTGVLYRFVATRKLG